MLLVNNNNKKILNLKEDHQLKEVLPLKKNKLYKQLYNNHQNQQ